MRIKTSKKEAIKSSILPSIIFLALAAMFNSLFSYTDFSLFGKSTISIVTFVGLWRYSYLLTNYSRAIYYRFKRYPELLKKVKSVPDNKKYPAHIYFIIPSYKEEPWVSVDVFKSLISEINSIPSSATLFISTSTQKEDEIISSVFRSHPNTDKIKLVFQHQKDGKRIAMGDSLRALYREYHKNKLEESVVLFMDGDSYLETNILSKTIPFFAAFPKLGALTTNEMAFVNSLSRWYKDWFSLKFGQRNVLFQSHALSNRVLTLTGRFSLFRATTILNEEFISSIENDVISNEFFGKFRFLMGDDKSSWFYLFKNNWDMLYIPDAYIYSLESRDAPFLDVSTSLPYRWYGNTLRNNQRAVKIKKAPLFIKYVLRDQIYSMWTSLYGISIAILLSIFVTPMVFPLYISWVLFVRVIQQNVIAFMGYPVSIYTIPLMLYSQWIGSFIKIKSYYNLNDQKWSKTKDDLQKSNDISSIDFFSFSFINKFRFYFGYFAFIFAIFLSSGIAKIPDLKFLNSVDINSLPVSISTNDNKDDSIFLNNIISNALPGSVINLPSGQIDLFHPLYIKNNNISIVGHDTSIVYHLSNKEEAAINILGSVDPKFKNLSFNKTFLSKVEKGKFLILKEPNNDEFFKSINSKIWKKKYPFIRQEFVFTEFEDKSFDHEIKTQFKNKVRVYKANPIINISIRDISIRGDINTTPFKNKYKNIDDQRIASSIMIKNAYNISLENISIKDSYSHCVNLDTVLSSSFRSIKCIGSLNKGKGGNGYFKIARTFNSSFFGLFLKDMRHLTIQWSSAYNRLNGITLINTDLNFHGGGTHHNTVYNISFNTNKGLHKWGDIYHTPNTARWAPPDYKTNILK